MLAMPGRTWLIATLFALALAAPAQAQLWVEHDSTLVTETTGNGNGVAEPGEALSVVENVLSAEFSTLTGVNGTLTTTAAGVVVESSQSAWPNLEFGTPAGNLTPFAVTLPAAHQCGAPVAFEVALQTDQGAATSRSSIPTGATGSHTSYDSTDVPRAIVDQTTQESTLTVDADGLAKGVRVRIGSIVHGYMGDLVLTLIAPNGARVVLSANRGADGTGYTNTVFSDDAAMSLWEGSAPFTGSFRPMQSLGVLDGAPLRGTWRLEVADTSPGGAGGIESWGLDLAPAVCGSNEPPPPPPPPPPPADPPKPGNGNGAGPPPGDNHPCHHPKPPKWCTP